ncbi:MAG: TonB-dependent receptor, partial [Bacteroidota bacterium]
GLWQASPSLGLSEHRLRGWSNRHQVWLLDGVRLLPAPGAYGLNSLDPLLTKRIEVAKNTGSVSHGGGALGGSIHLLSSDGAYSPEGFVLRGQGRAKYMSGGMEQRLRGELSLATPRTNLHLGSSWKRFGDRVAAPPLGQRAPSAYEELNLDFRYRYRLSHRDELTLALIHSEQTGVDNFEPVSLAQFTQWELTPRLSTLAYLRWQRSGQGPIPTHWKLTASFQRRSESLISQLAQDTRSYQLENELNRTGLELRVTNQWLQNWQSTTGLEAYEDLNQSVGIWRDSLLGRSGIATALLPDGAQARQVAFFSLHELRTKQWLITGGVRLQLQQMLGLDPLGDSLRSLYLPLSTQVGISYRVAPTQRAYAKFESGARLPQWYEWEQATSLPNSLILPQSSLEPETFVHIELGYKLRQTKWSFAVAGFHTLLSRAISLTPTTLAGDSLYEGRNLFLYQNLDRQRVIGVEAEISGHLGAWRPYLGLTYIQGVNLKDPVDYIPEFPPLNGRWGIRYQHAAFYCMLEGAAAATPNRLSTQELARPELVPDAWATLNAYAGYISDWFTLRAGALNLFDQSYQYHGSPLGPYGRTFWAGLDLPLGSRK